MKRSFFALFVLWILSPFATAQDMPLSQILIDGEGWKKVEGSPVKPKPVDPFSILGPVAWGGPAPRAVVRSADGSTTYRQAGSQPALLASPVKDGLSLLQYSAPYCPLRVQRGEKDIVVDSLAVDRDGRIYAATKIGIQVFDPIGRLSGVTVAPPGAIDMLGFENDELTAWVGETKYTRKLKTTGVK